MLHCDRNRASESGKRRSGDLIGRGVVGQVGLDGEQFVRLALLAGARGQRLQRLTIDTGDPDACRQHASRHRPANAACCTRHDRHSFDFAHRVLPPA
jgi:hypothetical protein